MFCNNRTKYGYPWDIGRLVHDLHFAVRGLHYDVEIGFFLKVDSFHQIQLGTVYRGRERLEEQEVLSMYKRRQLPVHSWVGCDISIQYELILYYFFRTYFDVTKFFK